MKTRGRGGTLTATPHRSSRRSSDLVVSPRWREAAEVHDSDRDESGPPIAAPSCTEAPGCYPGAHEARRPRAARRHARRRVDHGLRAWPHHPCERSV